MINRSEYACARIAKGLAICFYSEQMPMLRSYLVHLIKSGTLTQIIEYASAHDITLYVYAPAGIKYGFWRIFARRMMKKMKTAGVLMSDEKAKAFLNYYDAAA